MFGVATKISSLSDLDGVIVPVHCNGAVVGTVRLIVAYNSALAGELVMHPPRVAEPEWYSATDNGIARRGKLAAADEPVVIVDAAGR